LPSLWRSRDCDFSILFLDVKEKNPLLSPYFLLFDVVVVVVEEQSGGYQWFHARLQNYSNERQTLNNTTNT